jgi:hypothetical protein
VADELIPSEFLLLLPVLRARVEAGSSGILESTLSSSSSAVTA